MSADPKQLVFNDAVRALLRGTEFVMDAADAASRERFERTVEEGARILMVVMSDGETASVELVVTRDVPPGGVFFDTPLLRLRAPIAVAMAEPGAVKFQRLGPNGER